MFHNLSLFHAEEQRMAALYGILPEQARPPYEMVLSRRDAGWSMPGACSISGWHVRLHSCQNASPHLKSSMTALSHSLTTRNMALDYERFSTAPNARSVTFCASVSPL